ncbi:MAG: hypothetical protein CMJ48_13685 [Planctomycetaceae bacterium]|nr:hypothetical protein [Planctomycetaceae bacterium]
MQVVVLPEATQTLLRGPATLPAPILLKRSPREARIPDALERSCDVALDDVPLQEAVRLPAEDWKIPVRIDANWLAKEEVAFDSPVSLTIRGVPRRSALQLLLDDLGLTWAVRHDTLLITTAAAADLLLETRIYDVADLVLRRDEQGLLRRDFGPVIEAISTGAIGDWYTSDAAMHPVNTSHVNALVVRVTRRMHDGVERLLSDLRQMRHEAASSKPKPTPIPEFERRIRAAFRKNITVTFNETPFEQAVKEIAGKLDVPLFLDRTALAEDGIGADDWITQTLGPRPAKSVLERTLLPWGCLWAIRHDVLYITSLSKQAGLYTTRVYDVADLLAKGNKTGALPRDFLPLIELICLQTSGDWENPDHESGTITPFASLRTRALVMTNTRRAHLEVEALLARLRNASHERLPQARRVEKTGPTTERTRTASAPSKITTVIEVGQAFPAIAIAIAARPATDAIPQSERAIIEALASTLTVDFKQTPLEDLVAFLNERLPIPVLLDYVSLAEENVRHDLPVTYAARDQRVDSILGNILEPHESRWSIDRQVLLITTDSESETILSTRVYDVSDLVLARGPGGALLRDFTSVMGALYGGTSGKWHSGGWRSATISTLETPRINTLAIRHTAEIHAEVIELLGKIRRLKHEALPRALHVKWSTPEDSAREPDSQWDDWQTYSQVGGNLF